MRSDRDPGNLLFLRWEAEGLETYLRLFGDSLSEGERKHIREALARARAVLRQGNASEDALRLQRVALADVGVAIVARAKDAPRRVTHRL